MTDTARERVVVLDTAAFIAAPSNLFSLSGIVDPSNPSASLPPTALVTFYTVPEVISEARDARARARIRQLEGFLQLRAPSAQALATVSAFARATGDYSVLSLTDLKVIALTWMMEFERNGYKYLRIKPDKIEPRIIKCGELIPFEEVERREQEEQEEAEKRRLEAQDDGWEVATTSKRKQNGNGRRQKANAKLESSKAGDTPLATKKKPRKRKGAKNIDMSFYQSSEPQSMDASAESVVEVDAPISDTAKQVETQPLEMSDATKPAMEGTLPGSPGIGHRADNARNVPSVAVSDVHVDKPHGKVGGEKGAHFLELASRIAKPQKVEQDNTMKLKGVAECIKEIENGNRKHTEDSHEKAEVGLETEIVLEEVGDRENGFTLEETRWEEEVSDDEGWINEDNLLEHLARDQGGQESTEEDEERIGCVTTDFAMQNTMLQLGLKLLSVDGRRTIKKIKHFALRCESCGAITTELERKFCEKCGNATLRRVGFKLGKNGVAHAFMGNKKKLLLRGTKYPIPMPRGGRNNKDLILCEDQVDPVKQRRIQKQQERLNVDVLDPSSFYNAGAKFNPNNRPIVVGYGRRNPNVVRRGGKGR